MFQGRPLPGRPWASWEPDRSGRPPGPAPATLDGMPLTAADLGRLACDCQFSRLIMDRRTGLPEDLGRATRLISAGLRAYLLARDRRCRFPGCTTARNLHAHHILPWEKCGPTDKTNLLLLCTRHHHAIHDAGWKVTLTGAQATWTSPNQTIHHSAPPGADPASPRPGPQLRPR